MQARTVLNQLQEHLTVLFPPPPPSRTSRPPIWLPRQPTFSAGDKALVGRWRLYLKWEESNPLEIEEKDRATLLTRLQGVYRKAIVRMRFFSEIWYVVIFRLSANLIHEIGIWRMHGPIVSVRQKKLWHY